jgi:hypothetical protein
MDPKDPTPWFYDAILKQTTNRPVEALHDMQKAIELNDNRGVYRSSLQLDKDLAARSAGLGRIYNDLGFQRLGLVNGWKSVNTDPSNYSAHRLLADNYASQPRHEIARVSELLQSQLLQPNNITPIQPQLAQSNLLIVDGLGPSSLSYNEFNPLFTRNRFALQTSGIVASNNTWGEDVVHSGLWDKFSYSLGQFHYETDGFRKNNFLKQNIYNAFIQGDISSNLNLQAEYRHEDRKNGDLSVNFNQDDFSNTAFENRIIDSYRVGGRFSLSPKSNLIGSVTYQEVGIESAQSLGSGFEVGVFSNRSGFISELQNIFSDEKFSFVTGLIHINQNFKLAYSVDFIPPKSQGIYKSSAYSYGTFKITDNLKTTIGVSYDNLEVENDIKKEPINPKVGVIWNLSDFTTIRAAFFRSMSITRYANQTIEPTQIVGFNQFFDDINGTIAWRYGVAMDHKFSKNIFAGLEYTERSLDVPEINFKSHIWNENLARAYLYFSPSELFSLGTEYFYEAVDRGNNPLGTGVFNADTHWIPITLNIFDESGLSLMFKSTYVNQSGKFNTLNKEFNETYTGKSDFFVFDINLNYRLPKRYGLVTMGIKNIFDNRFNFQNTNQANSFERLFAPEMTLFTQVKLAF